MKQLDNPITLLTWLDFQVFGYIRVDCILEGRESTALTNEYETRSFQNRVSTSVNMTNQVYERRTSILHKMPKVESMLMEFISIFKNKYLFLSK